MLLPSHFMVFMVGERLGAPDGITEQIRIKTGGASPSPTCFDIISCKDNRRITRLPSHLIVGERLGAPDGITEQIRIKTGGASPSPTNLI
jgi:hypothetical protein